MARSETDSSGTDDMTSHESDLESDKEYDDDDVPLEPTRGERMLQIAQEGEWVDRLVEESRQEHARMTQSGTDSPMTNDDTTSREYDSESDREDEDDNLTEQTRGERLLDMAKEAIKAEESENNARSRAEAPRPTSSTPTTTRQGPTTTRHRPPAAQRIRLGQDEGDEAWLSLEQVASIIQLHNKGQMGCNIVTTLLQGTERKDWDNVWKHMRVAEAVEAENTGGPTPRVRDRLMTYGQLLFRHKKEGISGIYPMNMPGHWRVMIVSHILRQVLLLDPFGDASEPYGFTTDEIDSVQNSYIGYNVSTCPERLQTDSRNYGV
jgi:hypothetical protein